MKTIIFLLNLPWTLIGFIAGIISVPREVKLNQHPLAIVIKVKSLWWSRAMPAKGGIRGMTIGQTVILGPREMEKDLEHELVHVEQSIREPFIHFFLYNIEFLHKGYRNNKYEIEAYEQAGNKYSEK